MGSRHRDTETETYRETLRIRHTENTGGQTDRK